MAEITKLKDVASVQMGLTFRTRLEQSATGNVAVIQMKDFSADNHLYGENLTHIEMTKLRKNQLVRMNDLIFRSRGITNTVALVDWDTRQTVVSAPLLRIRVNNTSILPDYLRLYINLPVSQAFLTRYATGTVMRLVGKQTLDELEVFIPDLDTQHSIVELNHLAEREQHIQKQLSGRRRQLINGIIKRAVTATGNS